MRGIDYEMIYYGVCVHLTGQQIIQAIYILT